MVGKIISVAAIMSLFMVFIFSGISQAAHDEIQRITVTELKALVDQKVDLIILDARIKDGYKKGHIKGAHSFPWKVNVKDDNIKDLPTDKLIVTYCDCGPGESDSSDLAAQLIDLGLMNVKILQDPSIKGWEKAGYPME